MKPDLLIRGRLSTLRAASIGLMLALLAGARLSAADVPPPFVPGFERLARHDEVAPDVAGNLLLAELSCTACHPASNPALRPKRGPRLDGAGNRLNAGWITDFLRAPHQLKPGTTMPDVLHRLTSVEKTAAVEALVAYLGSLEQPFPTFKGNGATPVPVAFWNLGRIEMGRGLYHRIGCVACHAADEDYETVETSPTPLDKILEELGKEELQEMGLAATARRVDSVPLGDLKSKYSPKSLTHFLLDPHRTRPAGRMPNFQLGVVEAADIAAWLLRDQQPRRDAENEVSATATGRPPSIVADEAANTLVEQGQTLFVKFGCSNCHDVARVPHGPRGKPLSELDLAAPVQCVGSAGPGLPRFVLDKTQREAIGAALQPSDGNGTPDESPPAARPADADADAAEQVELTLLRLNCLGCHERNALGGVGRYRRAYFETYANVDIGDEGRLPPPLTHVGRKLRTDWLARVLRGDGAVRPHMRIRMPVYPAEQVKHLPAHFEAADRAAPMRSDATMGTATADLIEAGRTLLDTGCVQCHPLRGNALPGVVGVDLAGIAARVHPEWFREFLLAPGQLKPRTRMPTFFPEGKSQNPRVLAGDAERQIAAMWHYLKQAEKHRLPAKIEAARSQSYELIPKERPILLRTFMEAAGTHAVAVGFPQQVHYAFDAEQVRLAIAWRGRFLDAEGTWFVRFAPPAQPLGVELMRFPPGMLLAMLVDSEASWPELDTQRASAHEAGYRYLGHRLDQQGVPSFHYRYAGYEVTDRILPDGKHLLRTLTIRRRLSDPPQPALWLRGHAGKTLEPDGPAAVIDDRGLRVSAGALGATGRLRRRAGGMEWIVPLEFAGQTSLDVELRYQW